MKKQRWRFTKEYHYCSGCDKRLDMKDTYMRRYGFCDMYCGYTTYGLSWRDFY
jgi:hypothetical protein